MLCSYFDDIGDWVGYGPIFDSRLSSFALRLMNPEGLAARHLAVGNIVDDCFKQNTT